MILSVRIPKNYMEEKQYICKVLFDEFLGIDYRIVFHDCDKIEITTYYEKTQKKFLLQDTLFSKPIDFWLTENIIPKQPLKIWNLSKSPLSSFIISPELPVIYGSDPSDPDFFQIGENSIFLGLDIFGSAFFMLTRYEEFVKSDRDEHRRFPASMSLAYQEGFLDRPIINEYVEILWWCLKHLWPCLERKKRQPGIFLNHDVDTPYYYVFMPLVKNLRACTGDIIKRKSLPLSAKRFCDWFMVKKGLTHKDPYNKFDMIMDASDKYNVQSTFYFQSAGNSQYDGNYDLGHPLIKKLIKNINVRGHKIGLHPSYESFTNFEKIKEEFGYLKSICKDLGIKQETWEGRQHFLRWQVPHTWQNYEDAGLDYDSSLTYADYAGFRCGVCYEFSVFNLITRQELKLKERPLIVMECSLYEEKYMGLSIEQAFQYTGRLIDACRSFNGSFTILWHNNRLVNKEEVNLFNGILDYFFLSAKRD